MNSQNTLFLLLLAPMTTWALSGIKSVPENISILAGKNATNTIIISLPGPSSKVDPDITGLPEGATASFSPTSVTSDSGISKLIISTTKNVITAHYPLRVTGKGLESTAIMLDIRKNISFRHPGIFLGKDQLEKMKAHTESGSAPWKQALINAKNSRLGSKNYQPSPLSTVNADIPAQSRALLNDADAAYTQAILWYITKDASYASNSIQIMNAWAEKFTGGFSGSNGVNLAAWSGDVWPRAAEIIRYTYLNDDGSAKWDSASINQFRLMLKKQYIPLVTAGKPYGFYGGNLNAASAAASINIGVFNESPGTFLRGIALWRATLPAYIYQQTDGPLPVPPVNWSATQSSSEHLHKLWYHQTPLVNGLSQETCRDLGHVSWGLAALANGAETARLQGFDLVSESTLGTENAQRIANGIEFNSAYLSHPHNIPRWLCHGSIHQGSAVGTGEIFYNDLVNRRAMLLPQTEHYLNPRRPTQASYFMVWETLTHKDNNP